MRSLKPTSYEAYEIHPISKQLSSFENELYKYLNSFMHWKSPSNLLCRLCVMSCSYITIVFISTRYTYHNFHSAFHFRGINWNWLVGYWMDRSNREGVCDKIANCGSPIHWYLSVCLNWYGIYCATLINLLSIKWKLV